MDVSAAAGSETEQGHTVPVTMTLPPPRDVCEAQVDEADEHIEDWEEDEEVVNRGSFWFLSIVTAWVLALLQLYQIQEEVDEHLLK